MNRFIDVSLNTVDSRVISSCRPVGKTDARSLDIEKHRPILRKIGGKKSWKVAWIEWSNAPDTALNVNAREPPTRTHASITAWWGVHTV